MSYELRSHSGDAPQAVLAGNINSSDLSFTVDNGSGYPDGSVGPFVVTLDRGVSTEEKVLCDSRAGNVFTVNATGRGYDSTTPQSHASGTGTVDHTWTATEADEASETVAQTLGAVAAKGDLLSGTDVNRLAKTAVGADGTALLADSTQPGGIDWGAPDPAAHTHTSPTTGGGLAITAITDLDAELAARLELAGGTMTGTLTLAADPSAPLEAATQQYVIEQVGVEATDRANAITAAVDDASALLVPIAAGTADDLTAVASAAGNKALTVKGHATQTADLQEWQDDSATVLATVDKDGNAKFPNLAYAEAAGHIAIGAIAGGSSNSGSITFPAGRFSQPPNVVGSCENNGLSFVMFLNITATGCDFRVCNAGTGTTSTGTMRWQAKQMTSASADG